MWPFVWEVFKAFTVSRVSPSTFFYRSSRHLPILLSCFRRLGGLLRFTVSGGIQSHTIVDRLLRLFTYLMYLWLFISLCYVVRPVIWSPFSPPYAQCITRLSLAKLELSIISSLSRFPQQINLFSRKSTLCLRITLKVKPNLFKNLTVFRVNLGQTILV